MSAKGATGLVARALMAEAQRITGLHDWSDPTFPSRFEQVVEHINALAMDAAGRLAAEKNILWLLTARLRFFRDRAVYPLADEVIERPMFATGETRSGTTLMHALMSVDPDARALRFWEVMHPSPPPGTTGPDDPRIAQCDQEWREINAKMPKWLYSHPYNDMLGNGLPEDERTWAFDFRVMTPTAWWRVPMQSLSAGFPVDAAAQYRIHKCMLQAFQYRRPKKYWVLKGFHGQRLTDFFTAYPDAGLVWLHRDPLQVVASTTMMMRDIMDGVVGTIDLRKEVRAHLMRVRATIASTMSNSSMADSRIHHVRYVDFVSDPIAVVRGYYKFCGRELTAPAEHAMRDYLANNKGDRYGKFKYSVQLLRDAGENLDALNEEFAPYRKRFGIPIEHR